MTLEYVRFPEMWRRQNRNEEGNHNGGRNKALNIYIYTILKCMIASEGVKGEDKSKQKNVCDFGMPPNTPHGHLYEFPHHSSLSTI